MIIAGPGMRGPFSTHDLPVPGEYDPHAPGPHAPLLARAAKHYMGLPFEHPDRATIERITQRLQQGTSTIPDLYVAHLRAIIDGTRRPGVFR